MAITNTIPLEPLRAGFGLPESYPDRPLSPTSAVSWGAIAAGAAAAAALSLILLILGIGLGLSSVSPWSFQGISVASFGVSTILWLTLTQLLSSAMGGYMAGRLRTKWIDTHTDEVYFRDTAHGFLAWAVASLATAALLTSAIGSILGGTTQAAASVVEGMASTATMAAGRSVPSEEKSTGGQEPMAYFVDSLFRRNGSTMATGPTEASLRTNEASEVGRIFASVTPPDALPPEDIRYIGQLVAQRTGMSQPDAEKRVTEIYARAQAKLQNAEVAAKTAADKARKSSAYAALWIFVSLLIGAFVASLAATYGGRQRDA